MSIEIFYAGFFAALAILLWATSLLPEYLTALLFFAAVMVFKVAPANVTFSGFFSAAFWLILSGFVLGAAIEKVGLANRIARFLSSYLSRSWLIMVAGVIAMTYALAFVMPSNMGRITLLMPIILTLADRVGLKKGSAGRIALVLAVGFGTFQLSATILPANVPNLVMTGAAESAYGVHFAYLPYLMLHAPVLGILKGALIVCCLCFLFPAKPQHIESPESIGSLRPEEWRLSILLFITLILWMSDSVHGIQPAWVGLASACFCLLPRIGFLTGDEFATKINIRTCIYIAGILGLAAVVSVSGLGDLVGKSIIPYLPLDPAHPALNFASLVGLVTFLNFLVTANGVPALFTPLAHTLADHTGLPLTTVLMSQVVGYSTPLLPYQAAPIVVAMGMANVPARHGIKVCVLVGILTFLLLIPLDYLWFRMLMRIP